MEKSNIDKRPEIRVFAGPNGSGKSTLTTSEWILPPYINADEIKKVAHCSDIEAAQQATSWREQSVRKRKNFTFETVLSTERNLLLLEIARTKGYFVRGWFVLTVDPAINIERVAFRAQHGGHSVPEDKIVSRYHKSLALLPRFIDACNRCNIIDNTNGLSRLFKKKDDDFQVFPNDIWTEEEIINLITLGHK
ncbi:hypothetical protein SDC9_41251 [bioreactor metagenome]|uniref:UDP-N-acetylglucosamine kinase n=1 Tax=bioreactor metagenome TaxID=1076179 RepID=A0A644VUP2_9ZZZZ